MKTQRLYAVPMLLVAITMVSISHAQTERPRTGPETINGQDASPKPSNSGAHTAPATLPNSANNAGQAASGDKQHQGQFGGQKWTPPADDLTSPLAIIPDSPATVPQYVLFESL